MTTSKGYLSVEGGFTIECWFWRDAPPVTHHAALFTQRDQSLTQWLSPGGWEGRNLFFGCDPNTGGSFHFQVVNAGGGNALTWNDPSPTGYQGDSQWHHVALSLSKTDLKSWKLYLDGQLYTTQVASAPMQWNPGITTIGAQFFSNRGQTGSFAWDKKLAYFAIFDTEITANRIQEHYTAGSGGTVYYADDEVERLDRIFTWGNVPENSRIYDPAVSTLQGIQVANSNALTRAQETSEYAGGYVFANGQAAMVYHNRKHRYNKVASMILSDSGASAPELGVTFSTNEAFIFNDIRGDRPFGSQVRLQNVASRDTYGRKVTSFSLHITDPEELKNAVSWMLARYGEDRIRVSSVKFSCATSRNLLDMAYSRIDIGDMLVIDELTDPAPLPRMEFTIEGMSVESDWLSRKWDMSLQLSPNELNRVFEVGKSTLGGTDYLPY